MRSAALVLCLAACAMGQAEFELAGPSRTATFFVPASEPECVLLAAQDVANDVLRITGHAPRIARSLDACSPHTVIIGSMSDPASVELIERFLPAAKGLRGRWEVYQVATVESKVEPVDRALVVAGSDPQGTVFGLYAFSERQLGVDPLYFWADRPPEKKERLAWKRVWLGNREPTFRYRGWFLNDEDLLTEWFDDGGRRDIGYRYYHQVTSPQATRHVFEAMLRLGFNLVIPASFVDIRNPAEERLVRDACRRGLFVSQHHIEPLGVSGYGFANYWRDKSRKLPFSFVRHPAEFEETWRYYAERWAEHSNVVWQLGLRGVADRPVWASDPAVPSSAEARGKLISDAIALQWQIVRSVDARPDPPATCTLWMEGSELHRQGHLNFPEGVTVVFADNSPGWELQADFREVARQPGRTYGVYYHHQLWGSGPHLVQAVAPWRTHAIFGQAVKHDSAHYAMLNVGNVREFVLGLDASARMLHSFERFAPDRFLADWCNARFDKAGDAAKDCYRGLFASFVAPETGARALLDGEIIHKGRQFLGALRDRVRSGARPPWQHPDRIRDLLAKVRRQREAVERAGEGIDDVLLDVKDSGRLLFEANFVAQYRILLGLLRWLESGLEAGIALQDGDADRLRRHALAADEAIRLVRSGQALASRGEKWRHWYRGDRKMDIGAAEKLTRDLLAAIQNAQEKKE